MKQHKLSSLLLSVQKPPQYIGGEHNSVVKSHDTENIATDAVDLHFALCFPDLYEIGMSHLGLQLLYQIANAQPNTWAERTFLPEADMEALLREHNVPLSSLESQRPLSEFDIIGFSLQYELCNTSIVTILELGRVPVYANERTENHPIVIGGGPYAYHPEAIAPFFDAFLLGDGEQAIGEICDAYRAWKQSGKRSKMDLLRSLEKIEGIYIPSFFQPQYGNDGTLIDIDISNAKKSSISKRILRSLQDAPIPTRPLVPNIRTVHDRLSVEVMRGCVRGCRFCQAGYTYRPQRERNPDEILKLIECALQNTGFEEISLLSLSTADHCSIQPLLESVMDRYGTDNKIAVSFPSTRVDALKPEILDQVQRVRRTNFTLAPEAGTQRLRDVINKGVSDEDILKTCEMIFSKGWKGVKLYFMIGLPTETDEDVYGIINIAKRIKHLPSARRKNITVSVSTLVPKPHTAFQWCSQISIEETKRKQQILFSELSRAGLTFRYTEATASYLEGIFSRGGRELAPVIKRAYELGCRLDAWEGRTNYVLWEQAFNELNIDPQRYLQSRSIGAPLPWKHLSCGISEDFFIREYNRSLESKTTPSCLTSQCTGCAVCDHKSIHNQFSSSKFSSSKNESNDERAQPALRPQVTKVPNETPDSTFMLRATYNKTGDFRFLGHLELARTIQRASRRAGLPVIYTTGFHPMPEIIFGPPLQLGIESECELVDFTFNSYISPEDFLSTINKQLPPNLSFNTATPVPKRSPSIYTAITSLRFQTQWLCQPKGVFLQDNSLLSTTLSTTLSPIDPTEDLTKKILAFVINSPATKSAKAKQLLLADHVFDLDYSSKSHFYFSLRTAPSVPRPRPTHIVAQLSDLSHTQFNIRLIETVTSSCPGSSILSSG